jgi:hypothetical protein
MNLEFSGEIFFFKKILKYQFLVLKIIPVGAELFFGDGWTDGNDEANCRFSQLWERA